MRIEGGRVVEVVAMVVGVLMVVGIVVVKRVKVKAIVKKVMIKRSHKRCVEVGLWTDGWRSISFVFVLLLVLFIA